MKSLKNIVFTAVVLIAISCQDEIEIEIKNNIQDKVAVESRVTNINQYQTIILTRSADYFINDTSKGAPVDDLRVTESGTGREYLFHPVDSLPGVYLSTEPFAGKVHETYNLNFAFNNEDYFASAYLDTVPAIDSISYLYEYFNYFGGAGFYQIKMTATEPEPAGNYYLFNLYINDTLYNNELRLSAYSDDEIINGKPLINIDIYYLAQEEIKQDTNIIRLEMLSISREEFLFISAFLTETLGNGSLFSGPPADIPTNIQNLNSDNKPLGFFSASSVSSAEMMLYKEHNDSTNNPDYTR